jgi:hypothetical protein
MRKILCVLSLAAAAALTASTAQAAEGYYYPYPAHDRTAGEFGAGVVGGTIAGVGVSQGWWGATVAGAALPTTAAGAAAIGGVVGIGTVAVLDAALEPCRGFAAVFGLNKDACVDGHYVGYGPHPRAHERG